MSQKLQELSPSFSYSDIYGEELQQEIFEQVGSQEMRVLLNSDLMNGPYAENLDTSVQEENTVCLEDIKGWPFLPGMATQLRPLATTEVLSNDEYVGPFAFDVSVLPNYKSNNPWVYSVSLNKVYMDMNQQFPVDFKIKNRPDRQLYIRTTPQYSAQHQAGEPVCRCIQHDHHGDSTNKDVPEHVRQHVIRCSNKLSQYVGSSKEGQRLSIMFPLSEPQVGSECVREFFFFVCKSSCPAPGMNRRGIEVIFTLEDEQGNVFGRKCLKVRICACPKRDKKKEESEALKSNGAVSRGKKRKAGPLPPANSGTVPINEDDLKVYTINMQFTGKQNLLDILDYAEKVYRAKAYELLGQPEEQTMQKVLVNIETVKAQL